MIQVRYVHPSRLLTKQQTECLTSRYVPVIPLADLTEMVEGLQACKLALESCKDQIRGALPRMEIESAIDEAQRLLTQLEAYRKEGA